jgi:septal ring factor EnvC (AmiA/AmiB activator)
MKVEKPAVLADSERGLMIAEIGRLRMELREAKMKYESEVRLVDEVEKDCGRLRASLVSCGNRLSSTGKSLMEAGEELYRLRAEVAELRHRLIHTLTCELEEHEIAEYRNYLDKTANETEGK